MLLPPFPLDKQSLFLVYFFGRMQNNGCNTAMRPLDFLPLERQLFLVEHYLAHCQQFLRSKQSEERAFTRDPITQEHTAAALREAALGHMRLKIEHWQLELAWGQSLRERIVSLLRQREGSAASQTPTSLMQPNASQ